MNIEQSQESSDGNPLEITLAGLPEDQRKAFEELDKSYHGTGLRGLLGEALDSRHTPEHAMQSLDNINQKEWNKGHEGAVNSGIIMFSNQDYSRQFQLTWSRKGRFVKPSISVSYSVAGIR